MKFLLSQIMKKIIKKIFRSFGLEVKRHNPEFKNISFDKILLKILPNKPIILDVGANEGQSINKYLNLFSNPTIHAFEPLEEQFDNLKIKYGLKRNIYLNNCAVGESNYKKSFNKAKKSSTSSFNNFNYNSNWIKNRSIEQNVDVENFFEVVKDVSITSIDNYCKKNELNSIDLLKIDTQGFEDKVLEGSKEMIKKNAIKIIICEIMFDNAYDKYFSFSDIEKYVIPNNFRMVGLDLINNTLFSGLVFFADVMYLNKKKFNIDKISIDS